MSVSMPHYQVAGEGDLTVYLLHGIYGVKEYWQHMVKRIIDHGYRAIAWDAPGYGISETSEPFTFDLVAEAGAKLIAATGTKKNVVFGQSMGGQIVPRIRLKNPSQVHGLVISATIGYFGNKTKEEQEAFVKARESTGEDNVKDNKSVIDSLKSQVATGPEIDFVEEVAAKTPRPVVDAAVAAVRANPTDEAVAAYRAIDVPTLFVAGELDTTSPPATMQRLVEMVPGSELAVISRSAHYPWIENPEEFDRHFFKFLSKI